MKLFAPLFAAAALIAPLSFAEEAAPAPAGPETPAAAPAPEAAPANRVKFTLEETPAAAPETPAATPETPAPEVKPETDPEIPTNRAFAPVLEDEPKKECPDCPKCPKKD